jgi:hypothetical protein
MAVLCAAGAGEPAHLRACIPQDAFERLVAFAAWSDHWQRASYANRLAKPVEVAGDRGSWIVYSPSSHSVFTVHGDYVAVSDCGKLSRAACIESSRTAQSVLTAAELASGRTTEPPVLRAEQLHPCSFDTNRIRVRWQPSPAGRDKEELLHAIADAVFGMQQSGRAFSRVLLNDFNILDPFVWAVAYDTSQGTERPLLVGLEMHRQGKGSVSIVFVRFPTAGDERVISRILAGGVSLSGG